MQETSQMQMQMGPGDTFILIKIKPAVNGSQVQPEIFTSSDIDVSQNPVPAMKILLSLAAGLIQYLEQRETSKIIKPPAGARIV